MRTRVAVVGAGIVGLAAASALRRAGVAVHCFEQATRGHAESAGLTRIFRHAHGDPAMVHLAMQARAGHTSPDRLALFSQVGRPVIVHENHHNAPPGGSFTCAIYRSAIEVDWTLIPQASATRPPGTRVLVDKVGIPLAPP